MIDFPASPTDGQIFSASNGVVYKWSAAYSSWLAQNPAPPLGGTGDFFATRISDVTLAAGYTTMIPNTVVTGNAGLWYSTSTGRYTPPAGRYFIQAWTTVLCGGAGAIIDHVLRKNGTIVDHNSSATTSGNYLELFCSGTYDANGTDYFDCASAANANAISKSVDFVAFPLTGMQGPTGGAPGPVVGDFCAILPGPTALPTTGGVLTTMPVVNGNSGGYYTPANGQWKPPAGRYFVYAMMSAGGAAGVVLAALQIQKNGVVVQSSQTTDQGSSYCYLSNQVTVDANGSDIFILAGNGGAAGTNGYNITFGAYPTQGMVGPQGPPGGYGNATVGDFCADNSATILGWAASTPFVLIPTNILSGNSGGYYNATTGRWTPPAGRYLLSANYTALSSGAQQFNLSFRKNGVNYGGSQPISSAQTVPATGYVCTPSAFCLVDANGSDYFEVLASVSATGGSIISATITATPTQGMVGPQGPMGPAGVTQTVFFETGAMATGTTAIPTDNTIPQQTEGDQYMSLSITPLSATSKLIIEVTAQFNNGSAAAINLAMALFQDSAANAVAATFTGCPASGSCNFTLKHTMISGTTSPTTFKMRAGAGSSLTLTFNGATGAPLFGGVMASSIVIHEVP